MKRVLTNLCFLLIGGLLGYFIIKVTISFIEYKKAEKELIQTYNKYIKEVQKATKELKEYGNRK